MGRGEDWAAGGCFVGRYNATINTALILERYHVNFCNYCSKIKYHAKIAEGGGIELLIKYHAIIVREKAGYRR